METRGYRLGIEPPPYSDQCARRPTSFDHFIGAGEDRWRDRQPERLGGLQIDDQLELRRLLDRQIGRLGAVEDLSSVIAEATPRACAAGSITLNPAVGWICSLCDVG